MDTWTQSCDPKAVFPLQHHATQTGDSLLSQYGHFKPYINLELNIVFPSVVNMD